MTIPAAMTFVSEKRREFTSNVPADTSGLARRAAKLFSLSAAAGELAIHLKILPWQPGAAMKAAARCFKDWLAENAGGNPEERWALSQVAYFIESNQENFRRWHEKNASEGGRNISRLVGYLPEDESVFYVLPEIFKRDACKGYSPNQVVKWLDKRGMLETDEGRKQIQIKPPGAKKPFKVYAVKNTVDTLDTLDTKSLQASKKEDFESIHLVSTQYPNSNQYPVVSTLYPAVSTENPNKNNSVSRVSKVSTTKTPEEIFYQAFRNGEPAYPPRKDITIARDDAAVAAGFRSWRECGGKLPFGVEIREV
jgi:hypothetical protein